MSIPAAPTSTPVIAASIILTGGVSETSSLPVVNDLTSSSFDSILASAANATVADINGPGTVTTAHGMALADALNPVPLLGAVIGAVIAVVLTLLTPFDIGATFLLTLMLTLIPYFAQSAISGLQDLTSFTSQAVLNLEGSLPDVPKSDLEAVAGVVAIAAAGSDFFGINVLLAQKGALSGLAAVVLPAAITIDLIVLMITIVNWAPHLAILTTVALVVALIGGGIASAAWAKQVPGLEDYADYAFILSLVGLGAAAADYYISQ
jgi:hypothetical protein